MPKTGGAAERWQLIFREPAHTLWPPGIRFRDGRLNIQATKAEKMGIAEVFFS